MNTNITSRVLSFGIITALFLVLAVQESFSAGTPAGTVISNFATMNYKDLAGNSFPAFNSNTVTTTVAQLAGVAVTPVSASQVSSDSSFVKYPVVVTNTGNGKDLFALTKSSSQSWSPQLYKDDNRNGVLDSAELVAGTITATDSLAADSSFYLIARIFIPYNVASNTQDVLTVTATSNYTNTTAASGTYTTTVSTAVLSLNKTQSNNNPQTGQTVTYTLSYQNTGTGTATSAVLTDVLSTDVTFVNNSIVVPNGQNASYNSNNRTITWTVGNVAGSGTGTMTFDVTINAGVAAGTNITNQGSMTFTDSLNGIPKTPTTPTTTLVVKLTPGFTVGVSPQSKTQDVGLSVIYPITLTNTGNGTDSMKITFTSTLPLTWTFYVDNNNDSIPGNDGDYIFNPSNTGPLAQNGVLHILVVDTLPTSTADGAKDTSVFTFTSYTDTTITGGVTTYTTVKAPQLVMTKSVAVQGGGLSIPGAILVYTITYQNNGTGAASSIVITDPSPTFTTYVANSVKLNDVEKTDAANDDEVTVSNGNVVVNVGNVASNASGTVVFKVKIN